MLSTRKRYHFRFSYMILSALCTGPPREILQGGTRPTFWGPGAKLRFLSKLGIWGPIKLLVMKWWSSWLQCKCEWWSTNRIQKVYLIIFLTKLIIVENTPKKNQIKHLWLRLWFFILLWGPSEIHGSLLESPGPGPMHRLKILWDICLFVYVEEATCRDHCPTSCMWFKVLDRNIQYL